MRFRFEFGNGYLTRTHSDSVDVSGLDKHAEVCVRCTRHCLRVMGLIILRFPRSESVFRIKER